VVCSTLAENAGFMARLLDAKPVRFKPSIPNLVRGLPCVYVWVGVSADVWVCGCGSIAIKFNLGFNFIAVGFGGFYLTPL